MKTFKGIFYKEVSGVSIAILYLVTWILVFFIYESPYRIWSLALIVIWGIMFFFIYVFFIARSIKYERPLEEKEGVSKGFGTFVKPQMLTEEEVSISKEKKICLVCKGKVKGYNVFICSDCDTIYCQTCARALENLENACWVCDTPFDESKPSKAIDIEISEKFQKDSKEKKEKKSVLK